MEPPPAPSPAYTGEINERQHLERRHTVYCEGTVKPLTTQWVNTHSAIHGCIRQLHACADEDAHPLAHTERRALTHTF